MNDGSIFTRRDRFLRIMQPWRIWLITLVCVLGACIVRFEVSPRRLDGQEALSHADIAREITAGRGFQTRILTPLSLNYTALRGESAPDVEYPPLFAIILAIFAFPLRATAGSVVATSTGFHVLTAAALFLWSKRLTGDLRVACAACIAYGLSPLALAGMVAGTPATLTTFLVTNVILWLFWLLSPEGMGSPELPTQGWAVFRKPSVRFLLAGVVCGLAALADYRMALLAPLGALMIAVVSPRARLLFAGAFLGGACLTVAPWAARNWQVTGSPVFALYWLHCFLGTDNFPGLAIYCRGLFAGERLSELFWQASGDITRRVLSTLLSVLSGLPAQLGAAFTASAVLCFCGRMLPRPWAVASLVAVGLIAATTALWSTSAAGTLAAIPILALAAGVAWIRVLDRFSPLPPEPKEGDLVSARPQRGQRLHSLSLLVLALVGLVSAAPWRPSPSTGNPDANGLARLLAAAGAQGPQFVLTDIPWELAWETGKTSCALPVRPESVTSLQRAMPSQWIALSSALTELRPTSYLSAWLEAVTKPDALPDYKLIHRSPFAALFVRKDMVAPNRSGQSPGATR